MIYTTAEGKTFDLEKDYSSPERHVLQKLLLWRDLAKSVQEFREKKHEALLAGWDNSGPLRESPALQLITQDLEHRVALRLKAGKQDP